MPTIIETYIVKENICHRLLSSEIGGVADQLHFQSTKETFSHSIVITIASPAHTTLYLTLMEYYLILVTGVIYSKISFLVSAFLGDPHYQTPPSRQTQLRYPFSTP